jgi:hypothetical protein
MLLLGVVQAQAAGDVSFGSYDLLATEILTSATSSVTFSSLGDYAADYQHLQIRTVARSTRADNGDYLKFWFNADTSTSYRMHHIRGTGSTVSSTTFGSAAFIENLRVPANNETANSFGAGVTDILDPFESSKNTTIRGLGGSAPFNEIGLYSGAYFKTDSITSISIGAANGSLAQYSRLSLYGIRG